MFTKLRANIPARKLAEQQGDPNGLRLVVYFVTTRTAVDTMLRPDSPNTRGEQTGQKTDGANVAQMIYSGVGVTGMLDDQDLLKFLTELVEPESWQARGVYANGAGGRLVIRQTDQVHRKIRRMLTQLQVQYSDSQTMQKHGLGNFPGGGRPMSGGGGMGGGGAGFF